MLAALLSVPLLAVIRWPEGGAPRAETLAWAAVFFLSGVQLVALGVLGEYVGRLADEVRGRPLYVLREPPPDTPLD